MHLLLIHLVLRNSLAWQRQWQRDTSIYSPFWLFSLVSLDQGFYIIWFLHKGLRAQGCLNMSKIVSVWKSGVNVNKCFEGVQCHVTAKLANHKKYQALDAISDPVRDYNRIWPYKKIWKYSKIRFWFWHFETGQILWPFPGLAPSKLENF